LRRSSPTGVACARAGATIIHAHAYEGGGRRPTIGRQLRDLAEEVEMPFLTYLLGMVILEAEKALQDGRRNDGIQAMPLVADLARN
jgi:uncharacterized protein (DUF849 family)